jgi:hypothetical protein
MEFIPESFPTANRNEHDGLDECYLSESPDAGYRVHNCTALGTDESAVQGEGCLRILVN